MEFRNREFTELNRLTVGGCSHWCAEFCSACDCLRNVPPTACTSAHLSWLLINSFLVDVVKDILGELDKIENTVNMTETEFQVNFCITCFLSDLMYSGCLGIAFCELTRWSHDVR